MNSLKCIGFSGEQEDYLKKITFFLTFAQAQDLLETLHETKTIPNRPDFHPAEPTEAEAHEYRLGLIPQTTKTHSGVVWLWS